MNIEEAIRYMREGMKIRHSSWSNGVYIFKNGELLAETCLECTELNGKYFFDDKWEIFEEN